MMLKVLWLKIPGLKVLELNLPSHLSKSNRISTGKSSQGFTLIELLITLAILGILAAIIIPSYNAQVQKTYRSEAIRALGEAAAHLEQCRSENLAFNHANCNDYRNGGFFSDSQKYEIFAQDAANNTTQNAQDYTLRATPVVGSSQINDTLCAVFTLDHTGRRGAQNSDGDDTTSECWRQ